MTAGVPRQAARYQHLQVRPCGLRRDLSEGHCRGLRHVPVLIRLNGRLFPFGWLKIGRYIRQVDVATFKLMGVLEEYRRRVIDALLYLEGIRAFLDKDYDWLDGSLTSEENPMINLIASRMGAERYKLYRLYEMAL